MGDTDFYFSHIGAETSSQSDEYSLQLFKESWQVSMTELRVCSTATSFAELILTEDTSLQNDNMSPPSGWKQMYNFWSPVLFHYVIEKASRAW